MVRKIVLSQLVMLLVSGAFVYSVSADCGSVPFDAPILVDFQIIRDNYNGTPIAGAAKRVKTIEFDPLQVSVFEPQQRAIIAWNGSEEILLLSTDQRSTERSAVLEVIPLPSRPEVKLGSFATFEEAQRLVVKKRTWVMAHGGLRAGNLKVPEKAGRIDFEKKMGAHDMTVAEVLKGDAFVDFVQGYLKNKYGTEDAPIRPEFVKIIESYIDEGFRWFAFDVIVLDDANQSREPIEYRFASDHVFYPMRISTLERGETKVDLLVFTKDGASKFDGMKESELSLEKQLSAVSEEFSALEKSWKGFFPAESSLKIDQLKIRGELAQFNKDIIIR